MSLQKTIEAGCHIRIVLDQLRIVSDNASDIILGRCFSNFVKYERMGRKMHSTDVLFMLSLLALDVQYTSKRLMTLPLSIVSTSMPCTKLARFLLISCVTLEAVRPSAQTTDA
jgi:hypothetical protein